MQIKNFTLEGDKFIYVQNLINAIVNYGFSTPQKNMTKNPSVIGVWKIKDNTQN